jgi:hypothetical protein
MLALASAALLAACPARSASAPSPEPGTQAPAGPLVTTLQVQPSSDSVRLTLLVTNAGTAPVVMEFASGQSYDFAISDGDRRVWVWSEGRMFTQSLRQETLAPGETHTLSESWKADPALRGRLLTATAWVRSSSHPALRTQAFRLP